MRVMDAFLLRGQYVLFFGMENNFRSEEEIIRSCHMLSSVSEPSTATVSWREKREHA